MKETKCKVEVVSETPKTEAKTEIKAEPKARYAEYPFDYEILVNGNIIAKRNFKINNFIPMSMQSLDFKDKVDEIVSTIQKDLESKSRIFNWHYQDWPEFAEEPLIEPWECTFEFRVYENKRLVISKIWDGSVYPKPIREKVDLTNKMVKIVSNYDGKTYFYDKVQYFEENPEKITSEMYVLREMIIDKPDLLYSITKSICEACSAHEDMYTKTSDYKFTQKYGDKTYSTNMNAMHAKYVDGWRKALEEKTKQYFSPMKSNK